MDSTRLKSLKLIMMSNELEVITAILEFIKNSHVGWMTGMFICDNFPLSTSSSPSVWNACEDFNLEHDPDLDTWQPQATLATKDLIFLTIKCLGSQIAVV